MQTPFKPTLHPEFSYQVYHVGKEQTPVLVIDNFINDAHTLVDFCIKHTEFSKVDTYYPGLRMVAPNLYVHAMNFYLGQLFGDVFGLMPEQFAGGKSLYSMVVTPPEQLTIQQCLPHVDSFLSGDLACVHYLCSKDKGGTSLYRHKKTGYEKITKDRLAHYTQAVIDEGALEISHTKSYMNGSNEYYEVIAEIDATFNRMVVYPSNILHSGNIPTDFNFDPHPASGRLTLNSFIFSKRESV